MKKALAGPAKPAAKKLPERRAMIAAVRRRAIVTRGRAEKLTRRVDRTANRLLVGAWPPIRRAALRTRALGLRGTRWSARRLRPVAVFSFRALAAVEKRLLAARDLAIRATTRASAALTPERAICGVIVASAACLVASQFVDYRGIQIGEPGYAGLPAATPPTIGIETAGQAHSYALIPIAVLAALLAAFAALTGRRRLGRIVFTLGLASLAVILLIDLPAGLDAGEESTRFAGATAVLGNGFYAELAASGGLMLGGLLLALRPRARRAHGRRRLLWLRKPGLARAGGRRRRRARLSARSRAGRVRT